MRRLRQSELDFVEREFGSSLPLQRLRLSGGGQPTGRCAWQPFGALIQMDDKFFQACDPSHPLRVFAYPTLAHEALHVWQRIHGQCVVNVSVDGLFLGLTRGQRAYRYDVSDRDPRVMLRRFLAGNIEQQGQMFEDYIRSNIEDEASRDPSFQLIARYVRARTC
jgi:hypothetical protein